jgi:hypothetical protein
VYGTYLISPICASVSASNFISFYHLHNIM